MTTKTPSRRAPSRRAPSRRPSGRTGDVAPSLRPSGRTGDVAQPRRAPSRRAPSGRTATGRRLRQEKSSRAKRAPATASGERLAAYIGMVVLGLTLFGLVMVLSASSVTSVYEFNSSPFYQFQRQALWAVVGAVGFFVMRRIDYRLLQKIAAPFLGLTVVLLVAVLIPGVGRNINGSSRWLGVGPIVVQPSEIAKLAMVVFIADLLTRRAKRMDRSDLTVRPVVTILGVLSILLVLQPKLGTPLMLTAIAMMMLFIAGARLSSLAGWVTVGALLGAVLAYSAPYRRDRLLAFMDPWADPLGTGLQTIQSQVGIASGGLLGVGLGASRTKWGFLPYAHSDFIFAIVAEEVGLIGAAALIAGFLLLGFLGVRTALNAPDRFGMLLAAGITSWLVLQAFLNIGMAMGLLPITGEPLPFVSAGGSSLVMTLAAAGLLANIARRTKPA